MCKRDGKVVLLDPLFWKKAEGGLFLEFEGGIRVVKKIGWIDRMIANDSLAFVQLAMLIARDNGDWSINEYPEEINRSLSSESIIELFSYGHGSEYHFASYGQNHFSIYPLSTLLKPEAKGTIEGLQYYLERAKGVKLLTVES